MGAYRSQEYGGNGGVSARIPKEKKIEVTPVNVFIYAYTNVCSYIYVCIIVFCSVTYTMEPPAAREYAVDPVGVAMMMPSPCCSE